MQIKLTEYTPKIHRDYMSSLVEGGIEIKTSHLIKGIPHVFTLEISKTLLVFKDITQLKEARDFFERKLRPSTSGNPPPFEHFWHVWYGRLPKNALKSSNKEKVLNAINNALERYADTYSI